MIGEPPIGARLPVEAEIDKDTGTVKGFATWPKPFGNWFTQVWQQLVYLLNAPVKTITADYQIVLTDSVILMNGDVTATLPTAASAAGKIITCKAINAGGGTRTVSGNGANIDGAATWTTTTQYVAQRFASNGTQWWTV